MKTLLLFVPAMLLSLERGYAQDGKYLKRMMEKQLDSDGAPNTGSAPDYHNLYYWAASPYKHDISDSIPVFLKGEQRDTSADVFFIHPTSFKNNDGQLYAMSDLENNRRNLLEAMKKASWNADVTNEAINNETDTRSILYQATAFNGSCRIFAPRYRQANLKAFFVKGTVRSQKAFNLAYSDIKRAFEHYLQHDNHGRPIVIASHSQGSLHAIRLLQEFFDGKPLQKKLVCAYIVGYQIPIDAFKHIPVGNSPAATGCFVGWRSYQNGEAPPAIINEKGNSVCVNPLTWTTATRWAPEELASGSIISFNKKVQHSVSAAITPDTKILWVSLPDEIANRLGKMKNLHVFDYNLFWMNIRENVKQRLAAYNSNKN
jgi:Protein of unknown function (DUF3089)